MVGKVFCALHVIASAYCFVWPVMSHFTPLFPTCLVISEIRHISTLFVMLSVVFVDERDASSRTWQSNLNYNNSHNWDIGRVPCETDRVVLPRSEGMVLELPEGRTALRTLVLPEYSELVLPSDGLLQFSGNRDSPTCQGKGTSYTHLACATVLWGSNHASAVCLLLLQGGY